jgi:hypothetical protein
MKKKATPKSSPKRYSPVDYTARKAQRRRVADYLLRHGQATTLDLQIHCNALHPPRRVFELRHDFGWEIVTHWQRAEDQQGRSHRVGSYVLLKAGRAA